MNALELPPEFAHLEPCLPWAIATEDGRMRKRLASTMAQLTAYYHALQPELTKIAAYLDRWPLAALPENAKPLLYLALMYMEAAMCVEFFKAPDIPDALGAEHLVVFSGKAEILVNRTP